MHYCSLPDFPKIPCSSRSFSLSQAISACKKSVCIITSRVEGMMQQVRLVPYAIWGLPITPEEASRTEAGIMR